MYMKSPVSISGNGFGIQFLENASNPVSMVWRTSYIYVYIFIRDSICNVNMFLIWVKVALISGAVTNCGSKWVRLLGNICMGI